MEKYKERKVKELAALISNKNLRNKTEICLDIMEAIKIIGESCLQKESVEFVVDKYYNRLLGTIIVNTHSIIDIEHGLATKELLFKNRANDTVKVKEVDNRLTAYFNKSGDEGHEHCLVYRYSNKLDVVIISDILFYLLGFKRFEDIESEYDC